MEVNSQMESTLWLDILWWEETIRWFTAYDSRDDNQSIEIVASIIMAHHPDYKHLTPSERKKLVQYPE